MATRPEQQRPAGLDSAEARRRLAEDGANALPGGEHRTLWRIALKVLVEPMFLLLLVAGGVYLALGDRAEAGFLLASVFLVIGITLAQERKTQRALEALRDLSAPRALVVRDGRRQRIPAREVVRGDLLVLGEGDRIAADATLREGLLEVDESLLTGESVAVTRLPDGEHASLCASTVVTKGMGSAEVVATGQATAVGRIGQALAATREPVSGMQRASTRLVRGLAVVAVLLATAYTLLRWLWDGSSLLDAVLAGVALSMAIVPEEIPVILTVFLAMGAWRMARHQVLTRRMPAVEALGAVTVLAVDKTGTLTQNQMRLMALATSDGVRVGAEAAALPEHLVELARVLVLATPRAPFDPMEQAILAYAGSHATELAAPAENPCVREYPLAADMLAMTRAFATATPRRFMLATKGAPEAVVTLCGLTPAEATIALAQAEAMAAEGLRVLGVATGEWDGGEWPASQRDLRCRLLGFVGFGDPPREEVPAAVAQCRQAGVRMLMLTGDHPATARAIAVRIGMNPSPRILTGATIDSLDDEGLREALREVDLCARLRPEQKLRLVRMLQQDGDVVAMTGDGVNDAPALKAADIGVAMGERGTDVAREAAALVLLDDSFASIVGAIRQGRRIYDNIVHATAYVFAVHAPIIALALMPALLHWPVLLLPLHIVILELVIDPACALVFEAEPEAPDIMQRPPRPLTESPFAMPRLAFALAQGGGLAIILLAGCAALLALSRNADEVRTAAFAGLVACLLLLVLVHRSGWRRRRGMPANRWLILMLAGLPAMLALALGVPPVRRLLALAPPNVVTTAAAAAMLLASVGWLVLLQAAARYWHGSRSAGQRVCVARAGHARN